MKLSFAKRETLKFRELEPGDVFFLEYHKEVFHIKLSNGTTTEIGSWAVDEGYASDDNVVKVRAEMTIFR